MQFRSQSAMEYLMTYGWAILIIAIVMVALFQLGLFGGVVSPRATAGACQVYKSAAGSSLAGQCNNELPQFVAQFTPSSNSFINAGNGAFLSISNTITLVAWESGATSSFGAIISKAQECNSEANYNLYATSSYAQFTYWEGAGSNHVYQTSGVNLSGWKQIAVSYNFQSFAIQVYVNGQPVSGSWSGNPPTNPTPRVTPNSLGIGAAIAYTAGCDGAPVGGPFDNFPGAISNVQIYNTSLSQSEVIALYQEGIGGAPIDPTHIVGWWPLNGNAQDYSGNNNQGTATAIAYNGTWTSGYTQP